jgi:hypothetical protein
VNGKVEADTFATVPSTPCCAFAACCAFGVVSAACAPATLPVLVVAGAAALPAVVTGATTVTGVTLDCDDWTTWPGELLVHTSPVGVTTVELEVEVT